MGEKAACWEAMPVQRGRRELQAGPARAALGRAAV